MIIIRTTDGVFTFKFQSPGLLTEAEINRSGVIPRPLGRFLKKNYFFTGSSSSEVNRKWSDDAKPLWKSSTTRKVRTLIG